MKTAVATEPVSLAEAKVQVKREDTTADDTFITRLITVARERAEAETRRALAAQTWTAYLDCFPKCGEIELPYPPVTAITHVKYYDENGQQQTLSSSTIYQSSLIRDPAIIALRSGQVWPLTELDRLDAVEIEFVCGYTSGVNTIPESIKQAMLLMIGHWYENREESVVGTIATKIPFAAETLLFPYRVLGWGS